MSALAPTLETFFTERLIRQRQVSPNTIAAYRDTMRLLLGFAAQRRGKQPSTLEIDDLDAPLIGAFLDHLERERGNGVRTRNARLAAIRSLFRYAALRHPEHAQSIERVLAIPPKRFQRNLVTFLTEEEVDALLAAPDRTTWTGRRDYAMLMLAAQTGLRASELTGLTCADVDLGRGAHVSCLGKGRKQRITPLTSATLAVLRVWLAERGDQAQEALFPTRVGGALSRDAVALRGRRLRGAPAPVVRVKRFKALLVEGVDHLANVRVVGSDQLGDLRRRHPGRRSEHDHRSLAL
jgi:integrase/recombinase XerD